MLKRRFLHVWAAYFAIAAAVALEAVLLLRGIKFQVLRALLELRHGLGFADPACTTGYCDFGMFWVAGMLARHGQAGLLYHFSRYAAAASALLPYHTGFWPFVYPPTMLPVAAFISRMKLAAGYYLFSAITLVLSFFLLRRAGIAAWCILLGLCAPAAMWNLYLGQFGLLCGAILLCGLRLLERAPLRAALLLALLCIKPQYGLLLPVVFLATRNFRAVCGCALGVLALAAFSFWLAPAAWPAYMSAGRAAMRALLEQPFGPGYQAMGISVFWSLRSLHAGLALAYAGQAAASVMCGFIVWRLWRDPHENRVALTALLTLLASPYGFTDDLAVYSVLLPGFARAGTPWRNAGIAWLCVLPAYAPKCVAVTGFLATPLLVIAALVLVMPCAAETSPARQTGSRGAASGARVPARPPRRRPAIPPPDIRPGRTARKNP